MAATVHNQPPITVRERLIDLLRDTGYDYFTAAEHVQAFLVEFMASSDVERVLAVGGRGYRIAKRKKGTNAQPRWV